MGHLENVARSWDAALRYPSSLPMHLEGVFCLPLSLSLLPPLPKIAHATSSRCKPHANWHYSLPPPQSPAINLQSLQAPSQHGHIGHSNNSHIQYPKASLPLVLSSPMWHRLAFRHQPAYPEAAHTMTTIYGNPLVQLIYRFFSIELSAFEATVWISIALLYITSC